MSYFGSFSAAFWIGLLGFAVSPFVSSRAGTAHLPA
jgi:hypothetical protein